MQHEGFERPSRQAVREQRRALDAVDRRRKLIGLPILALGLVLVAAGLWSYRAEDETVPADVSGIMIERTTTSTSSPTSTTSAAPAGPTSSAPTAAAASGTPTTGG